jgi:hypothetical protein
MKKKSIFVEYEKRLSKDFLQELFEMYSRNGIVRIPTN